MKTFFISIMVASILAVPAFSQSYYFYSRENDNLNVQMPTSYYFLFGNYSLVNNNNKQRIINSHIKTLSLVYSTFILKNQEEKPGIKVSFLFDERGNPLTYTRYSRKGKLKEDEQYQYDKNYKVTSYQRFNSKNELREKQTYKYNDNGKETEYVRYNKKNEIRRKRTTVYNDSNKKTEQVIYRPGGTEVRSKYIYTYNPEGAIYEICRYNADGKLKYKWLYDCNPAGDVVRDFKDTTRVCIKTETDSLGNKIVTDINTYGKNKVQKTVSKYDRNKRIIEWESSNSKGKITDRETFKYDSGGNLTEYVTYRRKGIKIRSHDIYTYDKSNLCTEFNSSPNGDSTKCYIAKYSYDDKGNLLEIKSLSSHKKKYYTLAKYSYEYF